MSSPLQPAPVSELPSLGVLVVDDQRVVRDGITRLISCAPIGLRWVSAVATGAEALSEAARLQPDVVVLDVDLAGEDGLALIPSFAPGAGVLVLTSHGDPATRARASRLGARAFVEKHQPAATLLDSIVLVGTLQKRGEKAPPAAGASAHPPMTAGSDVQSASISTVTPMDSSTYRIDPGLAGEAGTTAIEYGLMAALIAVAVIGALQATGGSISALYVYWSNAVAQAL